MYGRCVSCDIHNLYNFKYVNLFEVGEHIFLSTRLFILYPQQHFKWHYVSKEKDIVAIHGYKPFALYSFIHWIYIMVSTRQ